MPLYINLAVVGTNHHQCPERKYLSVLHQRVIQFRISLCSIRPTKNEKPFKALSSPGINPRAINPYKHFLILNCKGENPFFLFQRGPFQDNKALEQVIGARI